MERTSLVMIPYWLIDYEIYQLNFFCKILVILYSITDNLNWMFVTNWAQNEWKELFDGLIIIRENICSTKINKDIFDGYATKIFNNYVCIIKLLGINLVSTLI